MIPEPSTLDGFAAIHAQRLIQSFERWTGRPIMAGVNPGEDGERLYRADCVVVSHGTEYDPIFNYGNLAAQRLFEMSWPQLTALPSRCSAEPVERAERARLMAEVTAHGFIGDYRGIRISATGKRFMIEKATVWNVFDEADQLIGQAAVFSDWTRLDSAGD